MCGKPPTHGFRTLSHSDRVCRACFAAWRRPSEHDSQPAQTSGRTRDFWPISTARPRRRSRSVCLCYKNGPLVSSGHEVKIELDGGGCDRLELSLLGRELTIARPDQETEHDRQERGDQAHDRADHAVGGGEGAGRQKPMQPEPRHRGRDDRRATDEKYPPGPHGSHDGARLRCVASRRSGRPGACGRAAAVAVGWVTAILRYARAVFCIRSLGCPPLRQDHPGDASSRLDGNVNWKTAPRGALALAHNRPPWDSTIERQIERPSPRPRLRGDEGLEEVVLHIR